MSHALNHPLHSASKRSPKPPAYYVPHQSKWPITAAISVFLLLYGTASILHTDPTPHGIFALASHGRKGAVIAFRLIAFRPRVRPRFHLAFAPALNPSLLSAPAHSPVDLMVMHRSCSSWRVSVKRASPAALALIMPAFETRLSVSVDLPWSTWAMTEMFRMLTGKSIIARIWSTVKFTIWKRGG